MILPVGSSPNPFSSMRSLETARTQFTTAARRLSSGRQINTAADNAAGLALAQKLGSQLRGIHQAEQNVELGVSLTQISESALAQSQDALQRIRELGVQAANGALSTEDRAAIAAEQQQLSAQIGSNVTGGGLNGANPLTASQSTVIQAGPNAGDTIGIPAQGTQISNTLSQLDTALTNFAAAPDATTAGGVVAAVDSAMATLSTSQAEVGATQNRFEASLSSLSTAANNVASSRSSIEDADIAAEAARAAAARIKTSMAIAALAQGNIESDRALRLLR